MALRALAALHARPRHLILGALVAGLLLARAPRGATLAAALAAAGLAGATPVAPIAAAAVVGGAAGGAARLHSLDRSALGPLPREVAGVELVLLDTPRATARSSPVLAEIAHGEGSGERVLVRLGRRLRRAGAGGPGAIVVARGRLRSLGPFESYARARGAHAALAATSARATGARRGGIAGMLDRARRAADRALGHGVPSREAALARGMVLGDDSGLGDAARADFQRSGLTHLVAASGQNVALLGALALPLLAWAGLGLRARLVGVLALIAAYVPLAGGGPSIQRAAVMGAAGIAALLAGRPASRWYALLLAAAATLAANPRAADDVGWQLSFAAVVAILALAGRTARRLRARGMPPALAEASALTWAATLGTAPLIAFHFGRLSLASLPANLLAAPAVAPVMWLGFASAAAGSLLPPIETALNAVAAFPLAYIEAVAHACAQLPAATVDWRLGSPLALAAAYGALAGAAVALPALRRGARRLRP